jgi:aminoglycoside phosphotransferase (APT) family kinase protein
MAVRLLNTVGMTNQRPKADVAHNPLAVSYLTDALRSNYHPACRVERVESLPERGRAGIPNYRLLARNNGSESWFTLHLRQSRREARTEIDALRRARGLGGTVPELVFAVETEDNELGAPFLLLKFIPGRKLSTNPELLNGDVERLVETLAILHSPQPGESCPPTRARIDGFSCSFKRASRESKAAGGYDLMRYFDQFVAVYEARRHLLAGRGISLLHQNLTPRRLVAGDDGAWWVLGWCEAAEGDYARDVARFCAFTLDALRPGDRDSYGRALSAYSLRFQDETLGDRVLFYILDLYVATVARNVWPSVDEKAVPHCLEKLNYWLGMESAGGQQSR